MNIISKEEIKEALLHSGYLLENRVNKIFNKRKWYTTPNDRYQDPTSGIEREIDLFAYSMLGDFDNKFDLIHSALLVECMNNREPIAFFENQDKYQSIIAGMNFSGFNENFREILREAQKLISQNKLYPVSTQYCGFQKVSKNKSNNGWIATHPDLKHDAITSLFKFIQYHKNLYPDLGEKENIIYGHFYRPLIILQGDLLLINQEKDELKIDKANHVKYKISKTDNDGFIFTIDVITEGYLESYLQLIEQEDYFINQMITKHRKTIEPKSSNKNCT